MLARGEGPLVEAFRRFGVLPAKWRAPGLTPVEWADRAALLGPATLAVHCNYLADSDIAILAKRKTSVVYCPKSHAFFGHPRHPLPRLMDAGVNVCLGTDSLASNDGLDLLEEMAQARDACLSVVPSALFAAASGAAGRFVGAPAPLGRIEPGFAADMTALWPRERWQAPPANSAIGMEKAESALSRLLEKNAIERRLGIAGGVMIA
ncbi:MAG: Aminodeoxyfutalosine deaminase [candidate division BRC1 bacterium ADurb.BinA364]|nr:MAG: Aminodeoxyfutalosine deaminase [candidate division BRC1 bacterium ADurb.BinA364]